MSYVLVAVAFSTVAGFSQPPTITHIGEFDTENACQHSQLKIAESLQSTTRTPEYAALVPTTNTRIVLQCLPQQVPADCLFVPSVCSADVQPVVILRDDYAP